MPAPVIAFEQHNDEAPSKKELRLYRDRFAYRDDLYDYLAKVGLVSNRHHDHSELAVKLRGAEDAYWDYGDYLERRVRRLERVLRLAMARDTVTDEDRAMIMETLAGKRAVGRDPKVLNEFEGKMLETYRAMDAQGKLMLRQLVDRLARTGGETEEA